MTVFLPQRDIGIYSRWSSATAEAVFGIIFLIWEVRKRGWRHLSRRLSMALMFTNAVFGGMASIEVLLYPNYDCALFGAVRTLTITSSTFYTLALTLNVNAIVHGQKRFPVHERWVHCAIWTLSIVVWALALADGAYGPAGLHCYITGQGQIWRFITTYIPVWSVFLIITGYTYKIMMRVYVIRSRVKDAMRSPTKKSKGECLLWCKNR